MHWPQMFSSNRKEYREYGEVILWGKTCQWRMRMNLEKNRTNEQGSRKLIKVKMKWKKRLKNNVTALTSWYKCLRISVLWILCLMKAEKVLIINFAISSTLLEHSELTSHLGITRIWTISFLHAPLLPHQKKNRSFASSLSSLFFFPRLENLR